MKNRTIKIIGIGLVFATLSLIFMSPLFVEKIEAKKLIKIEAVLVWVQDSNGKWHLYFSEIYYYDDGTIEGPVGGIPFSDGDDITSGPRYCLPAGIQLPVETSPSASIS